MAKRKKQKPKADSKVKPVVIDFNQPRSYKRGPFGLGFRYFGVSTMILLNVAMVMSLITRAEKNLLMDPWREGVFFIFLGFINLFLLVPLLFEANRVETGKETIRLYTLFWRRTLTWDKVLSFDVPRFFKFSVLKSKRCFYLINKYDMKPFDDLARTIRHKAGLESEDQ